MFRSLFAATALGALSGCSCRQPLRVGVLPWIGYEPLYLAEDFGLLTKQITLVKSRSSSETIRRLKAGEVEAAALTLDEVFRVRDQGVPLTVVLVFDSSSGADMLLVHSDITELKQLKGKRIGYEGSAVGELMMSKILLKAGLKPNDVIRVNTLPPDKQLNAWQNKEIDAIITYEPTATKLKAIGGQVLFDSREIPETIFDVLAVKTDVLDNCSSSVKQLLKADFLALNRMNTNFGDAVYRIANHEQIEPDAVKSALRGVVLPSLAVNRHYLTQQSSFYQAAQNLNKLMYEKGMLTKLDNFSNLFSCHYLPEGDV
ncbi:ABC transporter substrate-binding protein [Hydrogenovibrio kuenenii]|uniref:ABC transporter substrate-binding protein n=1 Tax=Hydrogenovibrio kuenenii TaxID=63658 RepID=UPI00146FC42B|nr:ABC transporter substrate-binding protein [Hydrogenovibrio kuenenii]